MQQSSHRFYHATDVILVARSPDADFSGLMFELGRHVKGYHQNRNFRILPLDLSRSIQTIHFGHLEIKNDQVGYGLLSFLYCFPTVGGLAAYFPLIFAFQQGPKATAHKCAVVHNKDAARRR